MKLEASETDPVEAGLAQLAIDVADGAVSPAARAAHDRLLLDYVAVVVAGLGDAACARAADALGGLSSDSASPSGRAFARGVCAHWFDWDDTHDASHVHGGAVIFPALLALWRSGAVLRERRTPRYFVGAAVAGYELACRIGGALRRYAHRGWMPTGSGASLGAAAAGAYLLGANAEGVRSAMGIAAANAGISRQALADKVNAKGILAGVAARTAVDAVLLASNGVQGPPQYLSGNYGLGALHAGDAGDIWSGIADRRTRAFVEEVSIKPYPCCRSTHAVIDAILQLRTEAPAVAEKVDAMRVEAPLGVVERCGAAFKVGADARLAAQFSIPYTAALALRRGRLALDDFSPTRVQAMSRELGPIIDAVRVARSDVVEDLLVPVRVAFTSGEQTVGERTILAMRGEPATPLSAAEQREKLRIAADGTLPEASLQDAERAAKAAGGEGPAALIEWLEWATQSTRRRA